MIVPFGGVEIVAPNLHRRFSGVTATIVALVPEQAKSVSIASCGPNLPESVPRVRLRDVIVGGWRRPPSGRRRIWHARRNDEMILGVLLARVLRQPWKLVFTSAARRDHTALTRFLLRRMDGVIATSEYAGAHLKVPTHRHPSRGQSRPLHAGPGQGRCVGPDRPARPPWHSALSGACGRRRARTSSSPRCSGFCPATRLDGRHHRP